MAVSQGLYKTVAYKKQSGIGVPAAGSAGQLIRRETATFEKVKGAFNSNEINPNQQYAGDTYGTSSTTGQVNGNLSPGSYSPLLASLCRGTFVAGIVSASMSVTIAGTGPTYTLTRSAGSYLTDGFKLGDVVQLTAGTFTGTAANLNLVIVALTATVATVIVPNGSVLTAQGPVATSTLTVINKKVVVPSSGQANDYYTFEEWMADISRSRLYSDLQMSKADIKVPANGNVTVQLDLIGLARTLNNTQQLTSPSAASTSAILSSENAAIVVAGTQTVIGTSLQITIDGQCKPGDPNIGSKTISDVIKGDIKVTGQFATMKSDDSIATLFENETALTIICAIFADNTPTSAFVSFVIPMAKLFKAAVDDGKKQIVETYDYTAQYNSAGGTGASTDTGIITVQDSAA